MEKSNRKIILIFSYIIFSSITLIAINLAYPLNDNNNKAYAVNLTNNNSSDITISNNIKSVVKSVNNTITNSTSGSMALNEKMLQLESSNKPQDIATFAYIWGYPLVAMEKSASYFTNPNSPKGAGEGPINKMSFARNIVNSSFTTVVRPNADTLYGMSFLDLKKEPLVLTVPPIMHRYNSFQFLDAYTNVFSYVGSRATGSNGGIYLIAGPNWDGQVPSGMTEIKSPTNLVWIINRILVNGPSDTANVNAIQDKIGLVPLSALQGKPNLQSSSASTSISSNTSKEIPVKFQPELIPDSGIKVYDEISQGMVNNSPNPPDPQLIAKFASIGIGPGKTPSKEAANNETIKKALETGIIVGEKLIDAKVANIGTKSNGWLVNTKMGNYGSDYLLRAAVAKYGLGANTAVEALYTTAFTDTLGKPLTGANNYVIHFKPGQTPPVKGFWSITLYNNKSYFADNPINRYLMGGISKGLKNNTDGSLDIYLQNQSPGTQKVSNWLPTPKDSFNLILRMYVPEEQILNGTWAHPVIERVK